MKKLILIVCVLAYISTTGQKKKKRERVNSFTDENGYEYVVGEELVLNTGSSSDGTFNYVHVTSIDGKSKKAESHFANQKFKIGSITKINTKSKKMVSLTAVRGLLIFSINLMLSVNKTTEKSVISNTQLSVTRNT